VLTGLTQVAWLGSLPYSRRITFLVDGDKLAYRDAGRKRLTPLGWVLVAIFAAPAALCYWWFKQQFAALGYAG
jgi:hypothetical protein